MKKSIIIISTFIFTHFLNAQLNSKNLETGFNAESKKFDDKQVKQYNNLKLYYIKAKPTLASEVINIVGNFVNLETAIKNNKILIEEVSISGSVNNLLFTNKSNDTILVQMGDVVEGGKQDRVVENDVLILPHETRNLSVYCVEHGRWKGGNSQGKAKFTGYHSNINSDIKKTIVKSKSQTDVWSKVAEKNSLNFTETSSGTYAAMTNNGKYIVNMKEYMNNFLSEIERDVNIVGILAVTGDRIIGCEIFATHKLLQSNAQNILNSFISEATLNGNPVTIEDKIVNDYLNKLLESEEKQEEVLKENGKSLKINGKKLKLSSF